MTLGGAKEERATDTENSHPHRTQRPFQPTLIAQSFDPTSHLPLNRRTMDKDAMDIDPPAPPTTIHHHQEQASTSTSPSLGSFGLTQSQPPPPQSTLSTMVPSSSSATLYTGSSASGPSPSQQAGPSRLPFYTLMPRKSTSSDSSRRRARSLACEQSRN